MTNLSHKLHNKAHRKLRVRSVVSGTAARPRMSVVVSNLHVSVQLIDDDSHTTLASATTVGNNQGGTMTEKAARVGTEIAKKAKAAKIKQVAFDRNGKKYHGRVMALAEAARKEGLDF